MTERTLSENLEWWRALRPDECQMDEFIRAAKKLEQDLASVTGRLDSFMPDYSTTHYCLAWDGLLISKDDAEFDCCTCFKGE